MIKLTKLSCRLCFKQCKESDRDSLEISNDYLQLTGFTILESDVPKKVCTLCIGQLHQVKNFINRCQFNETHLSKLCSQYQIAFNDKEASKKNQKDGKLIPDCNEIPYDLHDSIVSSSKSPKTDQKFVCQYCGVLCYKKELNLHLEKHGTAKQYFCHFCNNRSGFSSKYRVLEHLKAVHMSQTKLTYPCESCEKVFNSKQSRDAHKFRHHVDPKDYRYGCLICGKRFFKKHSLATHNLQHTGEKKYSCSICQAKFSLPQHVRVHIANIHNPKQVDCTYCGKSFTSQKYLEQHNLTHEPSGYICPLCPDKRFSLTTTLRTHMKAVHPQFPLPPPGTKLKNYNWDQELAIYQSFCSFTQGSSSQQINSGVKVSRLSHQTN